MAKTAEIKMKELHSLYKNCTLCPRNCKKDRLSGEIGVCGADSDVRVARAALHMWEEPPISGTNGSGTVFFSGCSLSCVFCQNSDISHKRNGKKISRERLAEIFLELQEKGAHNINLVTPTHFIPDIVEALDNAKAAGLRLPIVYNTGGYENVETLGLLDGYIDIYLPDFKYERKDIALKYSHAADYPEKAKLALSEMVKQTGKPTFDKNGIMQKGVIVRHLVLPGYANDSMNVIKYLYSTYKDDIYISIMNQYTPREAIKEIFPEISRKLTTYEYQKVVEYAKSIGVKNGFSQYGETAKESFIPNFDYTGV